MLRYIRSSDGSSFIAETNCRLATLTMEHLHITPESSWETRVLATAWSREYDHYRPHSLLEQVSPAAVPILQPRLSMGTGKKNERKSGSLRRAGSGSITRHCRACSTPLSAL